METTQNAETGFAGRYAAALYALAFERGELDAVVDQMDGLGRLLDESPDLKRLVANPLTDAAKAGAALDQALAAQGFGQTVRRFVGVAVANRRLRDLPRLARGFAAYVAQKRGEIVADVTTAQPLDDLQRNQLRARLTESGYGNARLAEHVDASLLGGLVLKIGTKLYDTSLKSRLSRLAYSLKGAA